MVALFKHSIRLSILIKVSFYNLYKHINTSSVFAEGKSTFPSRGRQGKKFFLRFKGKARKEIFFTSQGEGKERKFFYVSKRKQEKKFFLRLKGKAKK